MSQAPRTKANSKGSVARRHCLPSVQGCIVWSPQRTSASEVMLTLFFSGRTALMESPVHRILVKPLVARPPWRPRRPLSAWSFAFPECATPIAAIAPPGRKFWSRSFDCVVGGEREKAVINMRTRETWTNETRVRQVRSTFPCHFSYISPEMNSSLFPTVSLASCN